MNSCSKKPQILNNDKLAWAHVILFAFPVQSFLESQGFRSRIFYIVQTAHWTCTGAESGDEIWQLIWVDVGLWFYVYESFILHFSEWESGFMCRKQKATHI